MKAFAAADEFRGHDTRVWLFTIVRNTTINLLRRRRSERVVQWQDEMAEPVDTAADPESAMISHSRQKRIRAAIASLPDDYREALVLREFEGLSYQRDCIRDPHANWNGHVEAEPRTRVAARTANPGKEGGR